MVAVEGPEVCDQLPLIFALPVSVVDVTLHTFTLLILVVGIFTDTCISALLEAHPGTPPIVHLKT